MNAVYRICGRRLASTIPLPELDLDASGPADLSFAVAPLAAGAVRPRWTSTEPNGRASLVVGQRADGTYVLRFPRLAVFTLSADGTEIGGRPYAASSDETFRHLLLDHVIPRALARRGAFVFHASAVVIDGRAVGIVGPSGGGKSTLSARFGVDGYPVVSDDCLVIEDVDGALCAVPSYPGARLWPDALEFLAADAPTTAVAHNSAKRRIGGDSGIAAFVDGAVPLAALFVLGSEPVDAPRADRMTPRDGMGVLLQHLYRLDADGAAEFAAVTRIAADVPMHLLHAPDDLAQLGAVRDVLLSAVGATAGPAATR
jgi:hypothetical protein